MKKAKSKKAVAQPDTFHWEKVVRFRKGAARYRTKLYLTMLPDGSIATTVSITPASAKKPKAVPGSASASGSSYVLSFSPSQVGYVRKYCPTCDSYYCVPIAKFTCPLGHGFSTIGGQPPC